MEDDLNILRNGRQPQYFDKWKMTSIFWQMEDDLSILPMGDKLNMEDDINIRKRTIFLFNWNLKSKSREGYINIGKAGLACHSLS
jgi:hypothetical protein